MQFQNLLKSDEDRAVSPVIGVILMVAITVILAAVIGTFVLGLGDQVQQTAPSAQFQFDFDSSDDSLEVTHNGGDGIEADELFLSGDIAAAGGSEYDAMIDGPDDLSWDEHGNAGDTIRAGDGVTVVAETDVDHTAALYPWEGSDYTDGDEIRVVWQDADSDRSSTLRTWSR